MSFSWQTWCCEWGPCTPSLRWTSACIASANSNLLDQAIWTESTAITEAVALDGCHKGSTYCCAWTTSVHVTV